MGGVVRISKQLLYTTVVCNMDHTLLWCAIWMFFSSGCFVGYGESIWVVLYASVNSYYTLLWCAIWIIHYCGVQYGCFSVVYVYKLEV